MKVAAAAKSAGVGVVFLGGEGGDEWLGGGWTSTEYRAVSSAMASGRLQTAVRIASNHPRGRGVPKTLIAAVFEGFIPAQAQRATRKLRGRSTGMEFPKFIKADTSWAHLADSTDARIWQSSRALASVFRPAADGSPGSWLGVTDTCSSGIDSNCEALFNDLRVVEMLAATPDWAKQFTGAHRGILRTALVRAGCPQSPHAKTRLLQRTGDCRTE